MAITFPSSPTNGQLYTTGGRTWRYSSTASAWIAATPTVIVEGRNRLINGDMRIDQRNAGNSVDSTANKPLVDMWGCVRSLNSKFTAQRVTTAPPGFTHSLKITSTSAQPNDFGDVFYIRTAIEGLNVADLNWGTANAKTVTLSFWTRSSITGTHGGAIHNSDETRFYPFTYTISVANTWEFKTIVIPGATSWTWQTDTGVGMFITFNLGTASPSIQASGVWTDFVAYSATGAVSILATNGATIYWTGVQLEEGSAASAFERRSFSTELALCQRYYEKSYNIDVVPGTATQPGAAWFFTTGGIPTGKTYADLRMRVEKRTVPTVALYGYSGGSGQASQESNGADLGANTATTSLVSTVSFRLKNNSGGTITPGDNFIGFHYTADANLF